MIDSGDKVIHNTVYSPPSHVAYSLARNIDTNEETIIVVMKALRKSHRNPENVIAGLWGSRKAS